MSTIEITIVIAVGGNSQNLEACLLSLASQQTATVEVIVVSDCEENKQMVLACPGSQFILSGHHQLIPELWGIGIRKARGDIVAITTSHFTPADDWIDSIRSAHQRQVAPAIGGKIEPPSGWLAVDWATYFLRYSAYLSINRLQPVVDFAGDNGTYKAPIVKAYLGVNLGGFWETDLHRELRGAGEKLLFDPSIRVRQCASYRFMQFLKLRFRHGIQFGSERVARRGTLFRIVGIAAAPLIPGILLGKILSRVVRGGKYYGAMAYSMPVLLCFILAWTLGEVWGYLFPSLQNLDHLKSHQVA